MQSPLPHHTPFTPSPSPHPFMTCPESREYAFRDSSGPFPVESFPTSAAVEVSLRSTRHPVPRRPLGGGERSVGWGRGASISAAADGSRGLKGVYLIRNLGRQLLLGRRKNAPDAVRAVFPAGGGGDVSGEHRATMRCEETPRAGVRTCY